MNQYEKIELLLGWLRDKMNHHGEIHLTKSNMAILLSFLEDCRKGACELQEKCKDCPLDKE